MPIDDSGELLMDEYEAMVGPRTKLVSITHVSNALGTVVPVERIVGIAHAQGVPVLLDGAQAVPHMPVDVRRLDCEFYVFSGHKLFGPTGIGILYGKGEILEALPPFQGGGEMIKSVTFEKTIYNDLPYKFEAGTPNIAGAIGLGAAVDYVQALGSKASRLTRPNCWNTAPAPSPLSMAFESWAQPIIRRGSCPLPLRTSTPTISARFWTNRESPFAPGTTAPSR